MADVTDSVFRRVVTECGRFTRTDGSRGGPDVLFTEFVAADGLVHPVGREHLLIDLKYSEAERPIVAQIWGGKPDNIREAAKIVRDLGFDGLDINMGCPDKGVERQGGGAALTRQHERAREVINAAIEGAGGLPVSVKTRIGYNALDLDWIKTLASTPIAALTLHLRTRNEMSKVPAHWELVPELQELIRNIFSLPSLRGLRQEKIPDQLLPFLVGNGDVKDLADAKDKVDKYNVDGVMIGRGIFGNPWLFAKGGKPTRPDGSVDWPQVFRVMIHHSQLFEETYKGSKSFAVMRKFFGAYVAGHPRASEIKEALMKCATALDVESVLRAVML